MMAGPVMGITVTGKSTEPAILDRGHGASSRLVARVDQGGTEAEPAFGYTLHTGNDDERATATVLAGPDDRAEARRAGEHHRR